MYRFLSMILLYCKPKGVCPVGYIAVKNSAVNVLRQTPDLIYCHLTFS